MPLRTQTFVALILLASDHIAARKICNSTDDTVTHPNATGSYPIPGLTSPGQTADTWTVSTAIETSENNQTLHQSFSIDTQPPTNIISDDLPWTGCFISFQGLPSKTNLQGYSDDGDCTELFSKDCANAMTSDIKQQALSMSGQNGTSFDCNIFSGISPSACGWKNGIPSDGSVSANLGAARGSNVDTGNCTPSIGTGPPLTNVLFSVAASASTVSQQAENDLYDRYATSHVPVIIAAWLKNTSTTKEPWGDGRFLCMRPVNVTAGSRNATKVPSLGAITHAQHVPLLGALSVLLMGYWAVL